MHSESNQSSALASNVLWDVVEEHLCEAAYGVMRFVQTLQSPLLRLHELARYPEPRLLAHLDALRVAGDDAYTRLLVPALAEPDPEDPELAQVAAWLAIERCDWSALAPLLEHDDPLVHRALAQVAAWSGSEALDRWLCERLATAPSTLATKGLLALCVRRQLTPPSLMEWLQSDDHALIEVAAQATHHGDAATYLPIVQYLLDHEAPGVREAALLSGLCWGSQQAWQRCQAWALSPDQPAPLATQLYATLGTRADHTRLGELLQVPRARASVLRALGLSGNVGLLELLLAELHSELPMEAKLAAQSLGQIFGFSPGDDAFAVSATPVAAPAADAEQDEQDADDEGDDDPEALEALPALEDDALDADLVPAPESDLPLPDAAAIRAFCQLRASSLPTSKRMVFGAEYSPAAVRTALLETPLGWHASIGLGVFVRSGGKLWFDASATSQKQRRQAESISSVLLQRHAGF